MTYREHADHLAALMQERLGIRGKDLRTKLRRAGRLLPKHVHRDADVLLEALDMEAHPKLARRLDAAAIAKACKNVENHLYTIDPATRRWDRIIGVLSANAFNLLVTAGLVIAILIWRGYV